MMTIAFSGLSHESAFIYMDDLIVIGFSEKSHLENLSKVFSTCRKYNMKLNPTKCDFFRTEVAFLGHRCTDQGVKPDPNKIAVVKNYPVPKDKAEVKRFVAMANYYRRFIAKFAGISKTLSNLTRKKVPFVWSQKCQEAFEDIKNSLTSDSLLAYPNFEKEFRITVDACDTACGGVLSQLDDEGNDRPIMYISRAFKKCELNKPIIEKELLAIHFALHVLRPYIYGRKVLVFSDHKPLIFLYSLKNPSSRLTRIRLDLEEYQFDVIHISGKSNVVADALSRISVDDLKSLYDHEILAITRSMTKPKYDRLHIYAFQDPCVDYLLV
ncbi:MAG: hypothetical protein EOP45_09775 [Sphingobacteriaceae bacterium]|nr:MAG: hypothetical protein EOP45_09775 [Sphingobacteriaceae bacterium]